jgi:hypothetical protein
MNSKKMNRGLKSKDESITENKPPIFNAVEDIKENREDVNNNDMDLNFNEAINKENNYEPILIHDTVSSAEDFMLDNDKLKNNKISLYEKNGKSRNELEKINSRKIQVKILLLNLGRYV